MENFRIVEKIQTVKITKFDQEEKLKISVRKLYTFCEEKLNKKIACGEKLKILSLVSQVFQVYMLVSLKCLSAVFMFHPCVFRLALWYP